MTAEIGGTSPTWPQMTAFVDGALEPISREQRDIRTRVDDHDLWHRDHIERVVQQSTTWRLTVIGIVVAALGAIGTDVAVLVSLAGHGHG